MAGTWEFFTAAKGRIGLAEFNFSTVGAYKLSFHVSTGATVLSDGHDFSTMASLSTVTGRHASTNNLSRAGFTLSSNAWFASGSGWGFCANGVCVSANGAGFSALKYVVMRLSATDASSGVPILFATLSSTGALISVADGSAIKINGGTGSTAKIFSLA